MPFTKVENTAGRKEDKMKISVLERPSLRCLELPNKSVRGTSYMTDLDLADGDRDE